MRTLIFEKLLLSVIILISCTASSQAAKLFRKQSGTVTLTGTSGTVTIFPVNLGKSFLVFSATSSNNTSGSDSGNALVAGVLTNATTLTFSRGNATVNATIHWQIFEFVSGVTVQRGTANIAASPTDITLTAVDVAKSFPIVNGSSGASGNYGQNDSFNAEITSATNLRLTAGSPIATAYWQVVQYDDAIVKKVTATMGTSASDNTVNVTLSPAITNLNKAMVLSNHATSGTASLAGQHIPQTKLIDASTVQFFRTAPHPSAIFTFVAYVIEFTDNTLVERNEVAFAAGSGGLQTSVAAINASLTGSGVFGPGNFGTQVGSNSNNQNMGYSRVVYEITKPKSLAVTRGESSSFTTTAPYQVATFENEVRTYYSRASGAWEDNTKWSLTADGSSGPLPAGEFPSRVDNVVINSTHTITVNSLNDNYYSGVAPDDLGQANIGPSFDGSNTAKFYHTGTILLKGTLAFSGVGAMLGGYTWVETGGALTGTTYIVVTGNLEADSGSTLSSGDDLIFTGYSNSIINTISTSADDIAIDRTDATLCGTGVTQLKNNSGSEIKYTNGATIKQVCTTYTIDCTDAGCDSTFPVKGTTEVIPGGNGPGGVGIANGATPLVLWFRVDNGVNTTGTLVNSWSNSAGISALDVSGTSTLRPTLVANALNGFPEISFNGSNRLQTGLTLTSSNFINNQASVYVVNRPDNATQKSFVFTTDPLLSNRFSASIPWDGVAIFDLGTCCTNSRINTSPAGLTNYSAWTFDANTSGKQVYRDGTLLNSNTLSSSFSNHNTFQFNLSSNTAGETTPNGYSGDITEVIIFNSKINQAQRLIIQNYLSAKYAVALTANDLYTQDDAVNGHFDFNVAGIGRAADTIYHRDARGTGIVRIWNPQDLANGEYLMWGNDNASLTATTTGVDGTIVQERLTRIWRVSETGDVGNTMLSFDMSFITSPGFVGSNLRLLIDRDGDGFADNDVAPVQGSFSSNRIVFTGINLQSGDRFTLGNVSHANPLPVTLTSFTATARESSVLVTWETRSELNNHYFDVLRSTDAEQWTTVAIVQGAGTSDEIHRYEQSDDQPVKGISYYKLKQVDFDGRFSYSPAIRVEFNGKAPLSIYPNPSTGIFEIHHEDELLMVEVF